MTPWLLACVLVGGGLMAATAPGEEPTWFDPTLINPDTPTLRLLVGLDADNDGFGDLVAIGDDAVLTHYQNRGVATDRFLAIPQSVPWVPGGAYAADLNGDGFPDLVLFDATHLAWIVNWEGSFDVASLLVIEKDLRQFRQLSMADIDSDGDIDIAAAAGPELLWYENDGSVTPNFIPRFDGLAPAVGANYTWIGAMDMDGDGDVDVVSGIDLFENQLDSTGLLFVPRYGACGLFRGENGRGSNISGDTIAGDFDGDGKGDVAASSMSISVGGPYQQFRTDLRLYWGSAKIGGGLETVQYGPYTSGVIATSVIGELALSAADLDADGAMDIVQLRELRHLDGHWSIESVSPHRSGTFTSNVLLFDRFLDGARNVAFSDVNGDGYVDIFNKRHGGLEWLENQRTDRILVSESAIGFDVSGDGRFQPGEPGTVRISVSRSGGLPITGASARIDSDDPRIQFAFEQTSLPDFAFGDSITVEFPFVLDPAIECGSLISIGATLTWTCEDTLSSALSPIVILEIESDPGERPGAVGECVPWTPAPSLPIDFAPADTSSLVFQNGDGTYTGATSPGSAGEAFSITFSPAAPTTLFNQDTGIWFSDAFSDMDLPAGQLVAARANLSANQFADPGAQARLRAQTVFGSLDQVYNVNDNQGGPHGLTPEPKTHVAYFRPFDGDVNARNVFAFDAQDDGNNFGTARTVVMSGLEFGSADVLTLAGSGTPRIASAPTDFGSWFYANYGPLSLPGDIPLIEGGSGEVSEFALRHEDDADTPAGGGAAEWVFNPSEVLEATPGAFYKLSWLASAEDDAEPDGEYPRARMNVRSTQAAQSIETVIRGDGPAFDFLNQMENPRGVFEQYWTGHRSNIELNSVVADDLTVAFGLFNFANPGVGRDGVLQLHSILFEEFAADDPNVP
jgi:hypothetical protein